MRARVGSEAEVAAEPEGEVAGCVLPTDVEREGMGENLVVSVRRCVGEEHQVVRLEGDVANRERLAAGPHEVLDGADPADELVRRLVDQLRIRPESFELLGLLDEGEEPSRDGVGGGVVPCGGDDHVVAHELDVRERLAIDAGIRDDRGEVARGQLAPV
jgi:hypothetical protein